MRIILLLVGAFLLPTVAGARIAILDEGYNPKRTYGSNALITRQSCFSNPDVINNIQPDFPTGAIVEVITASLCKNGLEEDLSSDAAQLPRRFFFAPNRFTDIGGGLRHGVDVSNAGWEFSNDRQIPHHMIQIFGAGDTDLILKDDQPAQTTRDGANLIRALRYLAVDDYEGLQAVNISFVIAGGTKGNYVTPSRLCDQQVNPGQVEVDAIMARGIPVVVGLLNEDIGSIKTWPACLDGVIKIGGVNSGSPGGAVGLGIGDNGIDFFAKDTVRSNRSHAGSSLAAPRVAKALAMIAKRYPESRLEDRLAALNVAASRFKEYRQNGRVFRAADVKVRNMDDAYAYVELQLAPDPDPDPVDVVDPVLNPPLMVGPAYGGDDIKPYEFDFTFSRLIPFFTPNPSPKEIAFQNTTLNKPRDVLVKIKGIGSRFFVDVNNGKVREEVTGFSSIESINSVVLHRKGFVDGNNAVKVIPAFPNSRWGLREVAVSLVPAVQLDLGVTDPTEYGYDDTTMPRYTGLRTQFNLGSIDNDVSASMVGWDIDIDDETAVFANGNFIGHLTKGAGSSVYSPRNTFVIPTRMLRVATNELEFVQRIPDLPNFGANWHGYENEKWAVKDILIETAAPDLLPADIEIIDKSLTSSKPFEVTFKVLNRGAGASRSTVARFFISNNNEITINDTELKTQSVASLSGGTSRDQSIALQSSFVNQGYFVGVCLDSVAGETVTGNNCSPGVALKSVTNISPIIMLLLDD